MLIIVDLETTSADPLRAEILEIGAVTMDGRTFSSLVNPGFKEPGDLDPYQEALAVNRLTPEKIITAPRASQVMDAVQKWIRDISDRQDVVIMGGWNSSRYDSVILDRFDWIEREHFQVDVMGLAQRIMGNRGALPRTKYGDWKWPKLSEGMAFFKVEPRGDLHRALTDSWATRDILVKIMGGLS